MGIKITGKFPTAAEMMKMVMKDAVRIQKEFVRKHYPEVADFDITYDNTTKQFQYSGLTKEQIKTLPGVTET